MGHPDGADLRHRSRLISPRAGTGYAGRPNAPEQANGPQLLSASIKSADVLSRLMAAGAHAVTVRPELATQLATDPMTLVAMAQFDRDVLTSQNNPV